VTWTLESSQGFESDKIAAFVVPYLQGKFLDLGCGMRTVWPSAIGVDNGHHFGGNSTGIQGDSTDLSIFADESMDGVFSSHMLEHFPKEKWASLLREWARVLKIGGHLVLYVPSANLYPKMGEPGANPDHKSDIYEGDVENALKALTETGSKGSRIGWTLLESEERSGTNEYSFFIVVRKEKAGWAEKVWQRNPDGKKRCLIVRFGAIGDAILASSILPGLRKQGYHITYQTTPQSYEIIKHDPYIDDWWIQATDYVPNASLGPYWQTLAERFDKVVNLSESIEGGLLAIPGRLQHEYPQATRQKLFGTVNYHERTHDIADVPHVFASKFYATETETAKSEAFVRSLHGPVVMWGVHGSSCHKLYPWTQMVVRWLVEKAGAHVILSGDDKQGKELQDALMEIFERDGVDITHVHPFAGKKGIREVLSLAQCVDCVVGPETGLLNAVALDDVAKVIYLSHSSHENLTKHWKETTVLLPEVSRCPCFPCHQLHYGWDHCVRNQETQAAQCASSVAPEVVFDAVMGRLGFFKKERAVGLDFSDGLEKLTRKHSAVD